MYFLRLIAKLRKFYRRRGSNTGMQGEDEASAYLRKEGYAIIERNFRTPIGEIDIIARDGDVLCFVEIGRA